MKKRILCAVMAAGMMALSMSACGNDSSTSSTEESTTGSSSESASTDGESSESSGSASAIDMEGEPYTVHFMYLNQTEGESYTAVTEAANALALEEINMNIDFIPVTFGTASSTLQMMLAANEPLDLFCNTSPATLPSYIEAGYILNWADYLDQIPDVIDYLGEGKS